MKRILIFFLALGSASLMQAQTPAVPSVRTGASVPDVMQAPASNIDLLRQSLNAPAPLPAVGSPKPVAPGGVSNVPLQAPKPAVSQTKPAENQLKPAASAIKDNTLEMPLDIAGGKTVTAQVVAPKKTISPQTARRVAASKAKRLQGQKKNLSKKPVDTAAAPTALEIDIEKSNALLPPTASSEERTEVPAPTVQDAAAEAELEYAARMLQESKEVAQSGRKIPPPAAKNTARTVPAPNKIFNPSEFRPGVTWQKSDSTHFTLYTQKRENGISSSNMTMTFESAYQTLRRFIPWMMAGKVRVFVYQDYQSYLKHEPQAKTWTRALAYPTRGEIVVYDEPGKAQELKETFTHELTHIFTQQFFDKHQSARIMTPAWLDEGLAVLLEDQAYNAMKGGPWNNDLKTLSFQRDPSSTVASFGSNSLFGAKKQFVSKPTGKPLYFAPFESFMQEGSLASFEAKDKTQDWYFQAYAMVRFLLNPAGGASPSNRMQFEQFTRLLAQGEAVRNPSNGFLVKDKQGRTVYQPYSAEKALGRAFRYGTAANFEDNFWRWASTVQAR